MSLSGRTLCIRKEEEHEFLGARPIVSCGDPTGLLTAHPTFYTGLSSGVLNLGFYTRRSKIQPWLFSVWPLENFSETKLIIPMVFTVRRAVEAN